MDLNYLYHRHQVSLMRAEAAACLDSRGAHLGLARGYARVIQSERGRHQGEAPASLTLAQPRATAES